MDALTSFTHLTDNIPDWLTKLEDLAAQVVEQHSRFIKLTHLTQLKLSRRKRGSTESLRPNDDEDINQTATVPGNDNSSSGDPGILNLNADSAKAMGDVKRKRKCSTVSGASGIRRYRTRSMIIVYYDSAIQDAFESLVRHIASARNNLRKGKTAANFKARMIALGMEENPFMPGNFAMLSSRTMPVPRSSRTGKPTLPPSKAAKTPERVPAFEEADKNLEAAQSLCEVAAHQFLRDGDCTEEIQGTRLKFESCLRMAQQEVELLRREQQKPEEPEEPKTPKSEEPKKDGILADQSTTKVVTLNEKVDLSDPQPEIGCYAGINSIEVDDRISEASSVHLDLSAFRRPRRA